MAFTNSQATPRADISAMVNQAMSADDLFIGQKVAPIWTVDAKAGNYMKATLALAELLNADAGIRSAGGEYNRVNRSYTTDVYRTEDYGLEATIADDYKLEVDRFFNLEVAEAKNLARSLMISYEARVAAMLQSTSNFSATAALVAMTEANLATINLPGDIAASKLRLLKVGVIPNTVVMSANVFERVRRSTLLQNQVFGVTPKSAGQVTLPQEADIARAIGVDNLFVGKAPKNANKKGQSYSGSFVWSDTYIWVGNTQSGDPSSGGAARTLVWTADSEFLTSETYRDEKTRSNILRVRHSVSEKIIDETCGDLITTSYA